MSSTREWSDSIYKVITPSRPPGHGVQVVVLMFSVSDGMMKMMRNKKHPACLVEHMYT